MKTTKALLGLAVLTVLGITCPAYATVDSLSIKFGGGCVSTNTGTCTLKITASGSDLGSDAVQIQHSSARNGTFRTISSRTHALSDTGRATVRLANEAGCYRAITARNGNSTPDHRSRAICEN